MAHDFKKQFGQNFLRTSRFAKELVANLDLTSNDFVIEIGPGDGKVSQEVLNSGANLLAIEVDYDLLPNLIKRFNDRSNFDIIHDDILNVDINKLEQLTNVEKIKVVGSLPYNISKQIIDKFLKLHVEENSLQVEKMAFIVQEEVAIKYNATAPSSTALSLLTSVYANISKGKSIPASQFHPKPKVNGAIIIFEPKPSQAKFNYYSEISKLINIGFSSKKKKLLKNLLNSNRYEEDSIRGAFDKLNIEENKRPPEIDFAIWEGLYKNLKQI